MGSTNIIIEDIIEIIQTTKSNWAIEIEKKFVDFENRSRRNNLRINGIKEWKNLGKVWGEGKLLPGGKTGYGHKWNMDWTRTPSRR